MMYMLFSVIVPVYNIDKYIEKCLTSILNQTYKDFEVVLVNDGSTDKSLSICKEFESKDSRIRLFTNNNHGLSYSRNFGISKARGEYVVFVDGDDWIKKEALENFSRVINDKHPEVIISRIVESYPDQDIILDEGFESYLSVPLTRERAVKWQTQLTQSTWPAVKCIIRKEFICKNKLVFLENRIFEDIDWTSNLLYLGNTYAGCSDIWYYHRMNRKGSITASVNGKGIIDAIEIATIHYNKNEENENIKEMVFRRIMISVYAKIMLAYECSVTDRVKIAECMKQNYKIFKIQPALRYKLFIILCKLLGYKNGINLLAKYGQLIHAKGEQ